MFAGSHFGMFAKNVVENNLAEPRAMKNEMMWGKFSLARVQDFTVTATRN